MGQDERRRVSPRVEICFFQDDVDGLPSPGAVVNLPPHDPTMG
jgi:hypothetical protein